MKKYHLTFNREQDGLWYIDFPDYPFAHHNLMMVAGADKLCKYVAEQEGHPEKAVVDVTLNNDYLDGKKPDIIMKRFKKGYGASYENYLPDGTSPIVKWGHNNVSIDTAWLCPVTLLVLHKYPKAINLYLKK